MNSYWIAALFSTVAVVVVLFVFELSERESTALFIFAWDKIEFIDDEPFVVGLPLLILLLLLELFIKLVEFVGPLIISVLFSILIKLFVLFPLKLLLIELLVLLLLLFELEVEFEGTVAVVLLFVVCDGFRIDELVDVVDALTAADAVATPARVAAAADDVVVVDELALAAVRLRDADEPERTLCCCVLMLVHSAVVDDDVVVDE